MGAVKNVDWKYLSRFLCLKPCRYHSERRDTLRPGRILLFINSQSVPFPRTPSLRHSDPAVRSGLDTISKSIPTQLYKLLFLAVQCPNEKANKK